MGGVTAASDPGTRRHHGREAQLLDQLPLRGRLSARQNLPLLFLQETDARRRFRLRRLGHFVRRGEDLHGRESDGLLPVFGGHHQGDTPVPGFREGEHGLVDARARGGLLGLLDGGILAEPHLEPDGSFPARLKRLQIRDMRHELRRRARHHQPVFGKDFVALAKDADLRRLGLAAVAVVSGIGGLPMPRTAVQHT